MAFLAGLAVWLHRHPEDLKPLSVRLWLRSVRKMSATEWTSWIWFTLVFAAIAYLVVPALAVKAVQTTGVSLIDPNTYTVSTLQRRSLLWMMVPILPVVVIAEEWVFRGIIQRRLGRRKIVGVLFGALSFAAYHLISGGMLWPSLIPTFGGGLIFGIAYIAGGLKLSVSSHLAYDYMILLPFL